MPPKAPAALGQGLEPFVRTACEDKLGEVIWFRTDWQHGGAATGRAEWRDDDGQATKVVVKLPVNQTELRWLQRLQPEEPSASSPIPRLFASGEVLNGYDLAWVVIEWFPCGPLGTHWHDQHITRMCDAAAAFQAVAEPYPIDRNPRMEDWPELLKQARQSVKSQAIDQKSRWKKAHKAISRQLDKLVTRWRAREPIGWMHGDLHLANGMSRDSMESGPVCLIDFAEVHPGHWVEDAVYLERLNWARPERLRTTSPLKAMAEARKRHGLANGDDHPHLADLRRALYAATAPAFLRTEGGLHLAASLDRLEQALQRLK
ncbi:MAG: aminoglycoside phosphotransferase family protein [Phycisphaerales bacterium]|nr:aminoglycoside phosphotransferase family protein [Phycisphaerales bacterium]